MVGALLSVGSGYITPNDITESLRVGSSLPPGGGGIHRGWSLVPAKGLSLHAVLYPPGVDDPSRLLFPQYEHDEWGRLTFRLPESDTEAGVSD